MSFLGPIFSAIASVFGYLRDRSGLRNTAEMKQAKTNQNEADARAQEHQAVARKDTEKVQEGLAE